MKNIIIIGAGGVGREVSLIIEKINKLKATWNLIGFIDDNINSWNKIINGYQIIGGMDLLETLTLDTYVVIAIANYNLKKKIVNKINKQSKKASKESIVARQKEASGRLLKNNYEKDYEKVRDELLVKEDVIKQNNICINSFIKATAKEIDINEVIKKNRRKHKKEAKQEVVTEEVIEVIETIEEYEEISWKYDMATESNIPF